MPLAAAKACNKCQLAINEPGNNSFYHAACNRRPEQRAEHDRWRSQQAYRQLYNSSAWKRLRERVLAEEPVCMECHRAESKVVDHINDHKGNNNLFFSRHNVRGLCKACHDKKTGTEHGFGTASTPAEGGIAPGVNPTGPKTIMGVVFTPTPQAQPVYDEGTRMVDPYAKMLVSKPAPSVPHTLPVDPSHSSFPDGKIAKKQEYGRYYRKAGTIWILLSEDYVPQQ